MSTSERRHQTAIGCLRGLDRLGSTLVLLLAITLTVRAAGADDSAGTPRLGQVVGQEALARLRPAIFPDGRGLPPGQGLASDGARLYASQCAGCHGRRGEGASAPELVGGDGPLSAPAADKTLATYWPYATTLYDTLARSMPPAAPGRLAPDELYALCAWLLAENGLWSTGRPLDAAGLAAIRMPNRDGFVRAAP